MDVLYTAEASADGGREGRAHSSDGIIDLPLQLPKQMGGPGGAATNPEQLFAAGYAACFHSALMLVARQAHQDVSGSSVTARVGIGKDDTSFGLQVTLITHLRQVAGADAHRLVEQAHQVCPYSKATRGNIEVSLEVAG